MTNLWGFTGIEKPLSIWGTEQGRKAFAELSAESFKTATEMIKNQTEQLNISSKDMTFNFSADTKHMVYDGNDFFK